MQKRDPLRKPRSWFWVWLMRRQSKPRWKLSAAAPWAFNVMAPWALGVGVLVSFTAVAGQDSAGDWNVAPLTARARAAQSPTAALGLASFGDALSGDYGRPLLQNARLVIGAPEDMRSIPDERDPHVDLKPDVKHFPEVDRTHKGDPLVAIRPTFETRLPAPAFGLPEQLAFGLSGRISGGVSGVALAPRAPTPGDEAIEEEAASPAAAEPPATTQKTTAAASPAQTPSTATTPVADAAQAAPAPSATQEALSERALHGATPQVSRAVALGSSTPAQPDATPIEVSSFPRATLALSTPDKNGGERPDYAALVDHDKMDREKRCLAEAVYFEARSEPEAGQAAVAQVVLNRVQSGLYPSSVCGVVYQNRHHYHGCQFSFACEGKSLRITERESWATAVRIANEVMSGGTYISDVGRSTHYHANYVRPRWARSLTKMDVIGRHIFYRLKPGQT